MPTTFVVNAPYVWVANRDKDVELLRVLISGSSLSFRGDLLAYLRVIQGSLFHSKYYFIYQQLIKKCEQEFQRNGLDSFEGTYYDVHIYLTILFEAIYLIH